MDFVYESVDKPAAPGMNPPKGLPSIGPLVIPEHGREILACPHPNEAGKLADFLLSSTVESMLAESESRNIPVRPELAKKFDRQTVTNPARWTPSRSTMLPQAEVDQRFLPARKVAWPSRPSDNGQAASLTVAPSTGPAWQPVD